MATVSLTDGARQQQEECPVCNEVSSNVAVLPCAHKLCVDCVRKLCRSQQSGEMAICPLCKSQFAFFSTGSPFAMDTCEHSLATDNGAVLNKKKTNFSKTGTSYCIIHPDKDLVVFCFNCLEPSCVTCLIEHQHHRDHDTQEIKAASESLRQKLKDHSTNLCSKLSAYKDIANQIDMNKQQCGSYFESMWRHVTEAKTTLQETAASHADELHQHIVALKRDKFLEYGDAKSKTEERILELQTFLHKCDSIIQDGTLFDVVHEFKNMSVTAANLDSQPFDSKTEDVQCVFKPTIVESYLPKMSSNLIGHVYPTEEDCTRCSDRIVRQELSEQLKLVVAKNSMLKSSNRRKNRGSISLLV